MWSMAYPDSKTEVAWRVCNNDFEVRCTVKNGGDMSGCKLNIFNCTSGKNGRLCLGSFSKMGNTFEVHKKYILKYLALYNIFFESEPGFDITDCTGTVICSTNAEIAANNCDEAKNEDFAVLRAKKLLESDKSRVADFDIAEKTADNVCLLMDGYDYVDLPCHNSYEWVKICSLDEDFGLSSVAHIIYESQFIQLFRLNGEWYFGRNGKRMFAVCIRSKLPETPLANAADCSVNQIDEAGAFYHTVGIALLDDGQYFYRIS